MGRDSRVQGFAFWGSRHRSPESTSGYSARVWGSSLGFRVEV